MRAAIMLALVWLAASGMAGADEISVRAEVDRTSIAADGTVRLSVVVDGAELGDVEPPSLSNLESWSVINGPSVSSQFRFVNGVASSRRSFSWVLAPAGSGKLVIPPLRVQVAGAERLTQALQVVVTPGASSGSAATPGPVSGEGRDGEGDEVFIRAVVEPRDPYVGQPVRLTYRLYSRVEVAGVPQLQEVPAYPGFMANEIEGPQTIRPRVETVDGQEYRIYDIREMALVPTSAGRVELPPVTFSVPLRGQSRSRRSFFFNLQSVEPVYRRTMPVVLQVRGLPEEGRPEDFSGAVGRFRLRARPDRTSARTGEAVSLMVTVQGVGNLDAAHPPVLEESAEFTLYEPREQSAEPSSGDPFAAARSWEYILVPHLPGEQPMPALRFSVFDPETARYTTLAIDDITLQVEGAPLVAGGDGVPEQQELRRLGSDIHFIKALAGVPGAAAVPLYLTPWFWLLLAAPPLVNLAALAWRWRSRRSRLRLPTTRRRRARRQAERLLQRAAAATAPGPELYRLVAQALTEYVADKFGATATGLTYDGIASLLAGSRVPEQEARAYLDLLEACDCARFAPSAAGASPADALVSRARQALDALEARL